jgi:hypothetical protein
MREDNSTSKPEKGRKRQKKEEEEEGIGLV